jgi:predicted nucleotide-binding protein
VAGVIRDQSSTPAALALEEGSPDLPAARRPTIFVGGLLSNADLALAIQQGLDDVAEVTVFTQGVSRLSASLLDSLVEALDHSDCAVFVFPEEHNSSVSAEYRDALFQFGIMVGHLGCERTFVVAPMGMANKVIPSALLGICVAEYDIHRSDGNLRGAVGAATSQIRNELVRLGSRMRNEPLHEFPPLFDQRLETAESIYLWGMNQSDFLIRHFDLLQRRLSVGVAVRALLVAPKGLAVRTTRLRFVGTVVSDHETFRARASLARLCSLRESFPELVSIRTLDFPFSYGAFLLDGNTSKGIVFVKQYMFRTSSGSNKPKAVYEYGRAQWFDIISAEGEQLWEAGTSWQCQ